jgi:hypothetical protein
MLFPLTTGIQIVWASISRGIATSAERSAIAESKRGRFMFLLLESEGR